MNHSLNCQAPICAGDPTPHFKTDVLWFPGEAVCSLKWKKFQKNQRRINKYVTKGTFKHPNLYFTVASLEKIMRVTSATKGINPDKQR